MARFLHPDLSSSLRKWGNLVLALSFISGIFFGVFCFRIAGYSLHSLMDRAVRCPVSIVSLLIPFGVPFLFSAAAVYLCIPGVLPAICFGKVFMFSFVSCAVLDTFQGSGWLIRSLFLFSDMLCLILLYLYWVRHVSGCGRFSKTEVFFFLFAAVMISWIDYYVIYPFFQGLL